MKAQRHQHVSMYTELNTKESFSLLSSKDSSYAMAEVGKEPIFAVLGRGICAWVICLCLGKKWIE